MENGENWVQQVLVNDVGLIKLSAPAPEAFEPVGVLDQATESLSVKLCYLQVLVKMMQVVDC